MKRAVALLLALLFAGSLWADKVEMIWAAQTAPASKSVDTTGHNKAQVTIGVVSGSPDGTVTVYNVPPGGLPLVFLGSTTPSTWTAGTKAKTIGGPVGTSIVVTLTGNTTGAVGVGVVLK